MASACLAWASGRGTGSLRAGRRDELQLSRSQRSASCPEVVTGHDSARAACSRGASSRMIDRSARMRARALAVEGGDDGSGGGGRGQRANPPSAAWPIVTCFGYFLSVALTAPAFPALVNQLVSSDGEV